MEKIRISREEKEKRIREIKRIIVEIRSNPKLMRQVKEIVLNS